MSSHVLLCGSQREHPVNTVAAGKPTPDEIIQITLVLRRKMSASDPHPTDRHLSHDELAEAHGADPLDIRAVQEFANEYQLSIERIQLAARSVTLAGPLSKMMAAFCADVRLSMIDGKLVRTRQGHLAVPKSLDGIVVSVLGFDERAAAETNHSVRPRAAAGQVYYTPSQLAKIYNFPANTGKNQAIAVIELDGGYQDSDLQQYWSKLGLGNVAVQAVAVDGVQNQPTGDPDGPDGEVVLDIEVAGAVAPDAKIVVYFAPNTDQGFLNAINAAIHDTVNKPSVISISWGSAESSWTVQAMNAYNAAFHDAALLGISICVAAGDNGSSDGQDDGKNHVDFPASSPWVLACGGTRLVADANGIKAETVWNDGTDGGATGGGVSSHFAKPGYQANVHVPKPSGTSNTTGRGVPDVAGVADPETGYLVLCDGNESIIGGTSAVAPLWAGFIALCNEQLGKNLGWFHPALYGTVAHHKALRDIVTGTNGAYKATVGWDCCTGLGTPNGKAILASFESADKK